jgi:hypothetical protein
MNDNNVLLILSFVLTSAVDGLLSDHVQNRARNHQRATSVFVLERQTATTVF